MAGKLAENSYALNDSAETIKRGISHCQFITKRNRLIE
jgi:hypothetical protein